MMHEAGCWEEDGFGRGDRFTPGPSPSGERGEEREEKLERVRERGERPDRLTPGPSPSGERGDENGERVEGVRLSWDVSVRGVSGRQRDNARVLRRYQTPAEAMLWQALRGRRIDGLKFRRQVPVGRFIVDFMCFEAGLIVELDGSQHADEHVREYDDMRTSYLKKQGFEVLRFANSEVDERIDGVIERIVQAVRSRRAPLSPEGEGLGVRR